MGESHSLVWVADGDDCELSESGALWVVRRDMRIEMVSMLEAVTPDSFPLEFAIEGERAMSDPAVHDNDAELRNLHRLAGLFLVCAVLFFPMIFNPLTFDFFDAESDAARLEHVEKNLGALRLLFTGIGVAEAALGIGLWLWGGHVNRLTPGRPGAVAKRFSGVALVAGGAAMVSRLVGWLQGAEQVASSDFSIQNVIFLMAAVGFSLSFIVFGVLMIRGAMPTWLGGVWIFCGVIFWLGLLPLWFFVGSLVFGIWGLVRFRQGHGTAEQISAVRAI